MTGTVLSLFSGGGGSDLGLVRAGFTIVAGCEKDKHARAVFRYHHPNIPIYRDVADVTTERLLADGIKRPTIITGGTPCQNLSVAGNRAGLGGEKSKLFFEFARVLEEQAPDWFLWENVDNALRSNKGRDFAKVLAAFTGFRPTPPKKGWKRGGVCVGPKRTVSWRVLDPRGVGVAQRRQRVFVVGCARTLGAASVEVLFDAACCDRDSTPRAKTGAGDTGTAENGAGRTVATGGGYE